MNKRLIKPGVMALALIVAIALALTSSWIERVGPEQVQYGNLCGPTSSDPCYEPVLNVGFPVAYLFDAPGVSVERQLSFGEDNVHTDGLIFDIIIYFAVCLLAAGVVTARRARRR